MLPVSNSTTANTTFFFASSMSWSAQAWRQGPWSTKVRDKVVAAAPRTFIIVMSFRLPIPLYTHPAECNPLTFVFISLFLYSSHIYLSQDAPVEVDLEVFRDLFSRAMALSLRHVDD